jgi:hypothetical protein
LPMDPDSEYGSGSTVIESGSNPGPDTQPLLVPVYIL